MLLVASGGLSGRTVAMDWQGRVDGGVGSLLLWTCIQTAGVLDSGMKRNGLAFLDATVVCLNGRKQSGWFQVFSVYGDKRRGVGVTLFLRNINCTSGIMVPVRTSQSNLIQLSDWMHKLKVESLLTPPTLPFNLPFTHSHLSFGNDPIVREIPEFSFATASFNNASLYMVIGHAWVSTQSINSIYSLLSHVRHQRSG